MSTAGRGYGYQHRQLRKALIADIATAAANGKPTSCPHCGLPMLPGQDLHLDHTADRTSYRGMAHAKCNESDGAKRGNQSRKRKHSRKW